MPYRSTKELPDTVKESLPKEAQEIYLSAFNSASEDMDEEAQAHAVAWSAVKRKFKKDGERWVKKETADSSITLNESLVMDAGARIRRTSDGYLVAEPRVARTGVQEYRGFELGRPDMETIRVYRPQDEVFAQDSLKSYAGRPVTLEHPTEFVDARNWRKYAIGQVGEQILRDGEFIRVPMMVMDGDAIADIQEGRRELSLGYSMDLEWTSGVSNTGQAYDAVCRDIRANHLAVVATARGGPQLRIGDDRNRKEPAMDLKKFTVDGVTCQATDQSAEVIERHVRSLNDSVADLTKQVKDAKDELATVQTAIATKDTEIAKKDAEIATLKQQLKDAEVTPDYLDSMVRDRSEVIAKANAVAGSGKLTVDGRSAADIRRQLVDMKLGETAKSWNDDQIAASFAALTADAKIEAKQGDPIVHAFSNPAPAQNSAQARDAAYKEYVDGLKNAWKGPSQQKSA